MKIFSRRSDGLLGIFLASGGLGWIAAHPLCYDDSTAPDTSYVNTFCPSTHSVEGACCDAGEEAVKQAEFEAAGALTIECADYHRQV